MALITLMIGAGAMGNATAFGPDSAKAKVALNRIFEFVRYPSSINAVEID
jgi:hypothetical protein